MKSFQDILAQFLIGLFGFFLGMIIVGQFIENKVILVLVGMLTSGVMVLELPKTFLLVKARQFILIVGFCTLFFTIGFGANAYSDLIPNADASLYFYLAKGHIVVQIFTVAIANIVFWLQIRHYFVWKKSQNSQ